MKDGATRQRLLLDDTWTFHRGDISSAVPKDHGATYGHAKTGNASGAAAPQYDDSAWSRVDVPHDWAVEAEFDSNYNVSNGFRPKEVAWYRKRFLLVEADRDRSLTLEFDGVFRNATVWLNGHLLGTEPSGYTSFRFAISDMALFDRENVLAVRVDATDFEGWWYEGAGIYRHVWLVKTEAIHVAPWGVFVSSVFPDPGDLTRAVIEVETTVCNESDKGARVELATTVLDSEGQEVGQALAVKALNAHGEHLVRQAIPLDQPRLWSIGSPHLYRLRTALVCREVVVDEVETTFGVRSARFDPQTGFYLNGKPLKIQGMCNHQDHAGVGVALPDRIHEYRIERLKEMGCNAYRCAHNPPAPELLDACDRLGLLVMDETRLMAATPQGRHELEHMILRDRNHPCIILWSMGNEEPIQNTESGARILRSMVRHAHRLDPTRPTTAAVTGGWGNAFSLALDVEGINYSLNQYDPYHKNNPEHPLLSSEHAAAVTTRGIYTNDLAKGHLSSYDVNHATWACAAETAWRSVAERPFLAGAFIWTGFDYRGEPQPMEWPCISSHFGVLDTCGYPKDSHFYYQAWWSERPILHVFPHWNWGGREGQEIDVWAYGNSEAVELFLNGESLGRKAMPRNGHVEWKVSYLPGVLSARGYRGGLVEVSVERETTGSPAALRLLPDRSTIRGDGEDVSMVRVEVIDDAGRVVPIASNRVEFSVSGAGRLLGVGNGDPSCHESDKAPRRSAFNGLCMAIVQTDVAAGEIVILAEAEGLKPGRAVLEVLAGTPRPGL